MKNTSKFRFILIAGIILLAAASGCKNPLVSVIDNEVAAAVTPPEVVSVFPEDQEDDVPITLNTIIVTLSKNIDSSTVNSVTFSVISPGGNVVSGSRKVEDATVTFTPNSILSVGTEYLVVIEGIMDVDGNPVSESYSWTFTTGIDGDTVKPVINSVVINDGESWTNSSTVNVEISATDNFGVAQMNISTNGNFSDAGWIPFEENFSVDLPSGDGNKKIYIKLKDGSGLETGSYTIASIGLDTLSPEVALFSLEGGNSGTKNSTVSIDILGVDEEDGSGIAEYRLHTEGADWGAWAGLTDGSISLSDQALTVGTDETETFYLQVRDRALNVSDISTQSITYDFTPPEIDGELSNPVPGSGDNRIKSYVKVVFTEEMDTGTIDSSTVYITKGTEKISTSVYEYVDDKTAIEFTEFELNGGAYILEQNTGYNVFISGAVSDVAGNTLGADYTYTFSNDAFIDDTAPEGEIVLNLVSPDNNATADSVFDLMIEAEDDYNGVRAVKIWGDNIGIGYPTFESDASWELYSLNWATDGDDGLPPDNPGDTGDGTPYMSYDISYNNNITPQAGSGWELRAADGDYFIYYRFVDYANNESAIPGRLKVSLDTTPPILNGLQINSGSGYSNNTNDTVNIIIDAEDGQSGLSKMWVSHEASSSLNFPSSNSGSWQTWSPSITSYSLPSGEGMYYIYAEVQDFVGRFSTLNNKYATVILDYTNPVISFSQSDFLETNRLTQQTVTITDSHPAGSLPYQVPSGIAAYSWEQESGPGSLSFYSDSAGETPDSTAAMPYIKAGADDGTQDGTYEIRVTATDNAGNSSYNIVDFKWDTVAPDDVGIITAYHQDGNVLTYSTNSSMTYTTSAQPYATWDAPNGADFYIIIGDSNDPTGDRDPYSDPAVSRTSENRDNGTWHPFWADPDSDWDDSSSYEPWGYMRQNTPYLSAPAPISPGNNDGPVYLSFTAWDDAGNMSNNDPGTERVFIKFWIDTLAPVITDVQALEPNNIAYRVNFQNTSGGDGLVYDPKTQDDPGFSLPLYSYEDDRGSGIASYLWEQTAGPDGGTLTITDGTTISPLISAAGDGSEDGQYELKLTVTDVAGNVSSDYLTFIWDTTDPEPVTVSGPERTPDLTPTWSWTSGGGGNGTYEYQLVVTGNELNPAGWTTTTDNFFTPASNLVTIPEKEYFTLYVREYDDAGNYSDETNILSRHEVYVDYEHKTAPAVTRSGNYLRNSDSTTVAWNLGSGIGEPAAEYYRYWIEDNGGTAVMYGSGESAQIIGPFAPGAATVNVDLSAFEGVYFIKVQEYDYDNYPDFPDPEGWLSTDGLIGSSAVNIDATAPLKPEMNTSYTTGGSTTYNGYHLTRDTTPLFYWSSGGGDGIGTYRWGFNESDPDSWTITNYYYVYTSNAEGFYTFYVQERDTAGNWSESAEFNLEIDTTPPTLNSITLKNRHPDAVDDTTYTISSYVDIEVSGSGANAKTHPVGDGGDIARMYFYNSGGSTYYTDVAGSPVTRENWYLGTGDGDKDVYCYLRDFAGNVSVTRADGITLDATPPAVGSFSINGGLSTTTSSSVTLNSSYSGANWMRISTDNGFNWSEWDTPSTAKTWTLNTSNGYNGNGAKKVVVQFADKAGYESRNSDGDAPSYTQVDDSIFYGQPEIRYAWKGNSATGYINLYYENFPSDTGSSNMFEIYTATSPTGTKTLKSTTSSLSNYYSNYTEGQLYYFFIRVYNSDVGAFTNYSNYEIGYSSDMAIIYDDDDVTDENGNIGDTNLAGIIKQWLTRKWVDQYSTSYEYGPYASSMPDYTVTLVPEDEVSNTYSTENIIYGDPVIITPGTSWDYLFYNKLTRTFTTVPYSGKIRNIADNNRGIFAMHYAGYKFLKYTVSNWSSWGLGDAASPDPAPTNLDYVYDHGYAQYAGTTTYSYIYDYIWYRYIRSSSLYDNYRNDADREELMFGTPATEQYYGSPNGGAHQYSILNYGTSGENDTYFYADDPDYTNYYTVARQGRFLYWGYNKVPGYINGSIPFFYNTVRILKDRY